MDYKRGDIVLINFNPWGKDKEEKIKPAIIISDSIYNQESDLIIIVPLTENLINEGGVLRVRIEQKDKLKTSYDAIIEQIRCVLKDMVIKCIGKLKKDEIKAIEKGLKLILNL